MAKKKSKAVTESSFGGSLLVPIALDAIRVDSKGNYSSVNEQKSIPAKFGNTVADFTRMNSNAGLGGNVAPDILTTSGPIPKPGIHLQWTLPKAIANSTPIVPNAPNKCADSNVYCVGGLQHSYAPDRWFIIRYYADANSKNIPSKAWIVLSNSTDKYNAAVKDKIVWPVHPPNPSGPTLISVGAQVDYPSGKIPTPASSIDLIGVGPGDPTMIANHSASKSIFGLYDDLSDFQSNTAVTFSYAVVGWYEDPKKDIIYIDPNEVDLSATPPVTMADLWTDLMNQLDWTWQPDSVQEPEGSKIKRILPNPLPNISIYQGLLFGVKWDGPNPRNGYASGAPDNLAAIDVAMGRTSVEALSALIAHEFANGNNTQKEIEEVLEALQYSFLDKFNLTDGPAEVDAANHQNGYGVKKGGLIWDIRPKTSIN